MSGIHTAIMAFDGNVTLERLEQMIRKFHDQARELLQRRDDLLRANNALVAERRAWRLRAEHLEKALTEQATSGHMGSMHASMALVMMPAMPITIGGRSCATGGWIMDDREYRELTAAAEATSAAQEDAASAKAMLLTVGAKLASAIDYLQELRDRALDLGGSLEMVEAGTAPAGYQDLADKATDALVVCNMTAAELAAVTPPEMAEV